MMLSAGEGSRSWRVGTAHRPASASFFRPSFRPTVLASVSSMFRRCETMRSRMTGVFDLAEFERQRRRDMALLRRRLADVELARLAVVVGKAFRPQPHLLALLLGREMIGSRAAGDSRGPSPERIRLVVHAADGIAHGHVAILLEMVERTFRRIDREMREIGAAEPLQLRVEIGEVAALQQRIVGEVDARRHVLGHERDLLGLGEEIVRHAVEHQAADRDRRQDLFGNDLGRIENVEIEVVGEFLVEQLRPAVPIRGNCRT